MDEPVCMGNCKVLAEKDSLAVAQLRVLLVTSLEAKLGPKPANYFANVRKTSGRCRLQGVYTSWIF